MKEKFWNFTYRITNLINGKFYYGCHSTNNICDNYMGGGTYLHRAYNKHGKENFEIEHLKNFLTRKEMLEEERRIITHKELRNENCYNLKIGGEGGSKLGRKTSDKTKLRQSLLKIGISAKTHDWVRISGEKRKGRKKKNFSGHFRQSFSASTGVYLTPYGNFYSMTDAGKHIGVSGQMVKNWCKVMNKKLIVKNSRTTHAIYLIEDCFSKTYKEAGFDFIYFPENCKNFDDRKQFCIDNGVSFD